jgi:hypothetical protein
MDVMADPEQMLCDAGVPVTATAVAVTATVEVMAVPAQPFNLGVMVNVTVLVVEPLTFLKVPVISPVPLELMPVTADVLFLVQL